MRGGERLATVKRHFRLYGAAKCSLLCRCPPHETGEGEEAESGVLPSAYALDRTGRVSNRAKTEMAKFQKGVSAIPAAVRSSRPKCGRCSRPRRLKHSRCYASISTPATQGFRFLRRCRFSIEHMAASAVDRRQHQGRSGSLFRRDPEKGATTAEWLESIRREDAGRGLVTGVAAAVDDKQTH